MNYTDEGYAEALAFLQTKEGSVIISNEDGSLKINLLAFLDDFIHRTITQRELAAIKAPKSKLLDRNGRKIV